MVSRHAAGAIFSSGQSSPSCSSNRRRSKFSLRRHFPACLVVCDHASNRVPGRLCRLGLPRDALHRHIAWDIGAASVARRLAARLGTTAVLSGVSRLVIDCNRPLGHPTSICETRATGRRFRAIRPWRPPRSVSALRQLFLPLSRGDLDPSRTGSKKRGPDVAALIAVHSFTPVLGGQPRPWHVGVLWNRDRRLAVPLIEALRADGDLVVGDNEPYSGRDSNFTVDVHGGAYGRPHLSPSKSARTSWQTRRWPDAGASVSPPC